MRRRDTGAGAFHHAPGSMCHATRPSTCCAHRVAVERVQLQRVEQRVASGTPSPSCPGDLIRPSITAVTSGLPMSCSSAPSIRLTCSG